MLQIAGNGDKLPLSTKGLSGNPEKAYKRNLK